MTGLAVVTGVLTLALYVALRRATPNGVVLDPWPFILRRTRGDRFLMNLPEPGEPVCGAHPPREVLRELGARGQSITACYYRPHPRKPGIAHVGVIPQRQPASPLGLTAWASWTWIEPGDLPGPTYRLAWWRRALYWAASIGA